MKNKEFLEKRRNLMIKKYTPLLKEIKKGKSITKISKERKCCIRNVRVMLKKLFPKEFDELIYGKIIAMNGEYELRKIPQNQTNRIESEITLEAKKIFMKKGYIEEVGVWIKNPVRRYAIDLYHPKKKISIELCWMKRENFKILKKRLKNYEKYFGNVICVLLKDSSWTKKNRSYIRIKERLKRENINYMILDINKATHPSHDIP